MKKATLLLVLTVCAISLKSQNRDSSAFAGGDWKSQIITSGVVYKYCHFTDSTLFNSNQFISVIEIDPKTGRGVSIQPSPVLKETSSIASENGAIAAVNGSFFRFNYTVDTISYNSVDYIRKNGRQYAPNTFKVPWKREQHQLGALAVLSNRLYILKADNISEWEKYIYAGEVITSGPLLMKEGKKEKMLDASFYTTRHPRTAVAITYGGRILLITVDGRSQESAGVSLKELTKISEWLGAKDAINLDGGGSTTMYIKGMPNNGVVNHPCDNKKFDNFGERKVANAILVL